MWNEVIIFFQKHIGLILTVISIIFIIINIGALRKQNKTAIKSERNERFKNAIEQLGSDKNAIVLGGIYTLHRIAKEDESYRENVFNILCAYVRETTTTENYQDKYHIKPSEPIQTILNILCKKEADLKVYRTSKNNLIIDFSGAYLKKADLTLSNLIDAHLFEIDLTDANLMGAKLTGAKLYNATLIASNLWLADLSSITISKMTNLTKADLTATILYNTKLIATDLENTNLKGAYSSKEFCDSFEERIKSRIDKKTDLSGILGGYDDKNRLFKNTPIFGAYTKEEADEIIRKYNEGKKY